MRDKTRSVLAVNKVLFCLVMNPYRHLVRRWNWKAACMSACARGAVILAANLSVGGAGAVGAMLAEACYRSLTSGFHSAINQAFRFARPLWAASAVSIFVIPALSDSLEFLVHKTRGTQHLAVTVTASVSFTAISTLIELFAMRRGVFIVGQNSDSLFQDLKKIPRLIEAFWSEVLQLVCRKQNATDLNDNNERPIAAACG